MKTISLNEFLKGNDIKDYYTISSVTDILQILGDVRNKSEQDEEDYQFFYRGENKDYSESALTPKVFRANFKGKENKYYYDMLTKFPQEFEHLSNLSRLAKMQHYGCPTRLLDLTSNPLVALYFACFEEKENTEEDGCFYIFRTTEVLNFDSDKALMLSCLAHMKDVEQEAIEKLVNDFIKDGKNDNDRIDEKYIEQLDGNDQSSQFSRFIYEVVRERPAFMKYMVVAKDLVNNYIVRPLIQNERQKVQDGLFLICGLNFKNDTYAYKSFEIIKCVVKGKKKEDILEELDMFGINTSTLYCDMYNRVDYLQKKVFNKNDKNSN